MKFFNFLHFNKQIFLRFLLVISLFFIFISVSIFSYANVVSQNISNSVFRLHVIANSDSKEDQTLKYKVRDNLIKYMNEICNDATSKEEAILIAQNHIDDFKNMAKQKISDEGFSYPVDVKIEKSDFPTKYYGDIVLPTGKYDALKVKIGNACGQNWWCVMFPPLCFVDISSGIVPDESKKELKDSLGLEEFEIINTSSSADISYKFKLIEIAQNIKSKISNNK